MIKIHLKSILVDDQEKALQFYTNIVGFQKHLDIPMGPARWLTLTAPAGAHGIDLLLEPNTHPAAKAYQKALFDDGIPLTSFAVDDIQQEYERMTALGVKFNGPPKKMGPVTLAVFDDTCGN